MSDILRPHMVFDFLSMHEETWNIFKEWLIEYNNNKLPEVSFAGFSRDNYYDISYMTGKPILLVKQKPITAVLRDNGISYLKLSTNDDLHSLSAFIESDDWKLYTIILNNFNYVAQAFWETLNEQNK